MLIVLLIVAISCINATAFASAQSFETLETISFRDSSGLERTELAFRSPARGVPKHVIDMYCANIKLRLYWGVFREQIKSPLRTGQDVRRMARLARHYYPEIRAVDSPFDAPRLGRSDDWFDVKADSAAAKRQQQPRNSSSSNTDDDYIFSDSDSDSTADMAAGDSKAADGLKSQSKRRIKALKMIIKQKLTNKSADSGASDDESADAAAMMESPEIKQKMDASLTSSGGGGGGADHTTIQPEGGKSKHSKLDKIKSFVKKYAPKIGIAVYTRWATMWWLMMSCLYTKYYLWDPALDEFIKLKRTMIMYPDFLMLKLQEIDCLPVKFFQSILNACKILNPLMNVSFGQMSLDNMMRFKSPPT